MRTANSDSAARVGRPRDPATDRRIHAATFRLLLEEGYPGLSIEAVAAAAGVAKTTIYRRYPSKRELVVAALIAETEFPPPPPEIESREALIALMRQAVAILVSGRAVRVLASFLAEADREPQLLETLRARLVEPRRQMLLAILRAGVERGTVRDDIDLEVIPEMLLGSMLARHVRGLPADEAWVTGIIDTLWRAVATRPDAAPKPA